MDGDSEGHSDVDEALREVDQPLGEMSPSKKRKISPKSDDMPAEKGQVGVARHLNRSGRPMRKAAVKKNVSRQHDTKNSPVPTTSSDTSRSTSTDKKEQSSSPPTSTTSASSKRKQPSSTDNAEPASKKQMLGHSGSGQRVLGSSYSSKDTDEEDSAYVSQSDTSRRSGRKMATPKSRKSMSPPPRQQSHALSPKRKRVSEADEEESASKKQALEVNGSQVGAPAVNNHNSKLEKVEFAPEELVKSVETSKSNVNRKMAVPRTRKDSPSVTTPPSVSTLNERRQLASPDEEQISGEEQSVAYSDKASVGSASVRSIDTGSSCNIVEQESIGVNKKDEQPDIANKGEEEEQAMEETKEDEKPDIANKGKEEEQVMEDIEGDGQNNNSSAPVVPDTSEVPSLTPVAAPDKSTKKISLKDYITARSGAIEKRKAQVEDNGKTDGRQSEGAAQVESSSHLFEGVGEKAIW